MDTTLKPRMTVAEYLAMESASEEKHEYLRGEVRWMGRVAPEHSRLAAACSFLMSRGLAGRPCSLFSPGLRIRIPDAEVFTYADLTVVCGKLDLPSGDPNSVVNPSVLVEVLSDSSEKYDRDAKFAHYRRIATLKDYVLVSQDKRQVEVFTRGEGRAWTFRAFGEGEVVELPGLGVSFPLDELYFDPTA